MRIFIAIIFIIFFNISYAQIEKLPRATPESQGVESSAIINMVNALMEIEETDIHHIMVARNGYVIAEVHPIPFKAEHEHYLYSASKTFVALAIGIAIDENYLRLDDRVTLFFPEMLPDTISSNLAQITIKDLLTMSSGIIPDWGLRDKETEWIKTYLHKEVSNIPGKKFNYDSMCTYLLSAIIQRATGHKCEDYLKHKLFSPMGITVYDWEEGPEGFTAGGWGLRMVTEDLTKVGVMILNSGEWEGEQLISKEWIKEATAKQIDNAPKSNNFIPNNNNLGYGYQIWMCNYPSTFRADGAHGQFIIMNPEKDLVITLTGLTRDRASDELNTIFKYLMPGVGNNTLEASNNSKRLEHISSKAALPKHSGSKSSKLTKEITTYFLEDNRYNIKSITLEYKTNGEYNMTINYINGDYQILPFSYNNWSYATSTQNPPHSSNFIDSFKGIESKHIVAGNYAWTNNSTLVLSAYYVNWIGCRTFTFNLSPSGEQSLKISDNYSNNRHTQTIRIR